jgi:hypothetical protein
MIAGIVAIAGHRIGAVLETAPARRVAGGKILRPAARIDEVADRQYGARLALEERGGEQPPVERAIGDVAGSQDDGIVRRADRCGEQRSGEKKWQ